MLVRLKQNVIMTLVSLAIFICLIFIKQNRVTIIYLIHTRINRDRLLHYINLFLSLMLLFIATIFTK